ncbi:MAG: flippase-like domain-containing protein [Flavobacteriaceae bacterium]|nr:flippase-like domain-containing protein [Flavobacteriaceae bacterium]
MKLAIVIGAFLFIYQKTTHTTISLLDFTTQLKQPLSNNYTILILLSFTIFNWFFEILKWKTLVYSIKKITFLQATKQSLGSLTASLFTPNRIGEYAIKSFYYQKKNQKKILLLNLISNGSQMAITILFGVCGLVFVVLNFEVNLPVIRFRKLVYYIAVLFIAIFSIRFFINKKTRGFYLSKIIFFIKNLTNILVFKTLLFSIIRYLIFSHQFYFLLWLFGIETDYYTLILLIFSIYLIASVIPSLPMFDWLIKGSVAVFIFDLIGVNELIIVSITTIMWLLNFALPAVIGSYFVLNFKLVKNTDITT